LRGKEELAFMHLAPHIKVFRADAEFSTTSGGELQTTLLYNETKFYNLPLEARRKVINVASDGCAYFRIPKGIFRTT
jgi:hypothetical protein